MKKDDLTETMKKATTKVKEFADSEAVKESRELLEEKAKVAAEKAKELANSETVKETKEYIGEKAKVVSEKASEMISPEAREKAKQAAEGISQKASEIISEKSGKSFLSKPVLIAIAVLLVVFGMFSFFNKPKKINALDYATDIHISLHKHLSKNAKNFYNEDQVTKSALKELHNLAKEIDGKKVRIDGLKLKMARNNGGYDPRRFFITSDKYDDLGHPGLIVQVGYVCMFQGKDAQRMYAAYRAGSGISSPVEGTVSLEIRHNPIGNYELLFINLLDAKLVE